MGLSNQPRFYKENMKNKNLSKITGIGIFSALAIAVALICQIIPPIAGFLSLDAKDAVIAIASFVYGPVSAVIISFISALVELITFSTTGWYGFIMNFASSAVFSLTASLIYKQFRSLNGALIGFLSAIVSTTGVMLLLNIFVTPLYMEYIGVSLDRAGVIDMIPKILFPFNFAKSLMNSAVAMLIYKPISTALKGARLIEGEMGTRFNRNSVIVLAVGGAALIAAVVILFII